MSKQNGASDAKPDVQALKDEIKQTRAELGETVQALAAKADVKARAKDQVEQTKAKVRAQAVEAGEKVRDAAVTATDKVRAVAASAGATAKGTAAQATDKVAQATDKVKESGALDRAEEARAQVRSNPVPLAAVLAGVAAIVGVILIFRGRRR
jgi:cobalamin biosynthesis Mg chelatase CobN